MIQTCLEGGDWHRLAFCSRKTKIKSNMSSSVRKVTQVWLALRQFLFRVTPFRTKTEIERCPRLIGSLFVCFKRIKQKILLPCDALSVAFVCLLLFFLCVLGGAAFATPCLPLLVIRNKRELSSINKG